MLDRSDPLGSGPTDVKRGAIADCADLVGVPSWRLDRQRRKGKHALWFYKPAPAAPDERTSHTGSGLISRCAWSGPMIGSWGDCWLRSSPPGPIPSTLGLMSGERRAEMYRVDITADLNDGDHTGYLWTRSRRAP